jgi:hypothetical protein
LAGAFVFCLTVTSSIAEIGPYISRLEKSRNTQQLEITNWKDRAETGAFSREMLAEFVLQSYSVWLLESPESDWKTARLEVYEMLDPQGAFGAYSALLSIHEAGRRSPCQIESDCVQLDQNIVFWKGRFLLVASSSSSSLSSLHSFVTELAPLVNEPNLYPVSVTQLPSDQLIRDSMRYYLGPMSMESNTVFPSQLLEKIGFEKNIEIAFARYGDGDDALFLIAYPTVEMARQYFASIQRELAEFVSPVSIFSKRSGPLVSLFLGSQQRAVQVLDKVQYSAQVKWIYEKQLTEAEIQERHEEVVSFFGIVTSSILFSGFAMLAVISAGVVVGLIRFQVLKSFPHVKEKDDMIRLELDRRTADDTE